MDNKLSQIRDKIKSAKKPLMLFDADADGSTSYLQLKNVFSNICGFPFNKDLDKQQKLLEFIDFNYDLVIIFDIPYLHDEFLDLLSKVDIIWVDHHPTNDIEQIKKYNIMHFNPLDYNKEDNRPACFWSYKIADSLDNLWLVSLGSVSDFFLLDVIVDFYNFDKSRFNILFKITEQRREMLFKFILDYNFNNENTRQIREDWIQELTYSCGVSEMKNFFDFICRLDNTQDILKAFRLIEKLDLIGLKTEISAGKGFIFEDYCEMITKYKKILKKALDKGEKKFYFYEYSGKISFAKTLSEEIKFRFKNTSVVGICFKKIGGNIHTGSFRSHNFLVNDLLERATKGLDGRGGGHNFAAGCVISNKDYEIFKRKIFDIIEEEL